MIFRILPSANVTITINKSNEAFFEAMHAIFEKSTWNKTHLVCSVNYFIINRNINRNANTSIGTEGLILDNKDVKYVDLKIRSTGNYVVLFSLFWYIANLAIFILFVVLCFTKHTSIFYILLPIVFAGLGWYFTTGSIKVEIENLVDDIRKAAK
ncbi:MAG: hypothetical protein DI598_03070 [Pseudopedobacter saltans]|uniref:Uncharacterized protein n=1 Tax=Pseudopedobacter saltans TaxID=151895 RepID=A0A2W5F7U7_9SPHI|nr:MAG: hypothetical protein DI598_03070 [Pseudopedobacter saltans]